MAQVSDRIDALNDQVNFLLEVSKKRQGDAIRWRAVTGQRLRSICQDHFFDP